MDPATIIGIIIAFAAMFAMLMLEGASPFSILLPSPMIFVFGATIAVAVASGTMKDLGMCARGIPKALLGRKPSVASRIDALVELAGVARSEGFLALEPYAQEEEDRFFSAGLQSLADGVDGEALRQQLEDDIDTKAAEDKVPAKFYTTMGAYAPTIGVIGTVVALTQALENLSEPEQLGSMIAAAFVATLWGLVSSNLMWLPIGARLGRLSELEVQEMNVTMEGLLAIQEGSQPLLLEERLRSLVPSSELAPKRAERAPAEGSLPDGGEGSAIRSGSPKRTRTRRRAEEARDNPDRWMASYMDVVTVLMCLFIVLYAMSTVDEERYEALRLSLATGFGREESDLVEDSGLLISEELAGDHDTTIFDDVEDSDEFEDDLMLAQQEYDDLMELKRQLRSRLLDAGHEESVEFTLDEQGLHVHLIGAETFFDPYESKLSADGAEIMGIIAPVIAPTERFFEVGGHADQRQPLHTYATNWELSSARATSALRELVEEGEVNPTRIVSVGYGHEHPISDDLWRNRRVDVSILSDQPDRVRELLPQIRDAAQAGEELDLGSLLEASN